MAKGNGILKELRGVVARLTRDPEHRRNLLPEVFLEMIQAQTEFPGHPLDWYVNHCEDYARTLWPHGNPDLGNHGEELLTVSPSLGIDGRRLADEGGAAEVAGPAGRLVNRDNVELVAPHLSNRQQRTLDLLMKGFGVRETARQLGISHVAVIKHRRKIARIAGEVPGLAAALRVCGNRHGETGVAGVAIGKTESRRVNGRCIRRLPGAKR